MQDVNRKPFQSGREVYRHFIPGYEDSPEEQEVSSVSPIDQTREPSSGEALRTFVAQIEALKAELRR